MNFIQSLVVYRDKLSGFLVVICDRSRSPALFEGQSVLICRIHAINTCDPIFYRKCVLIQKITLKLRTRDAHRDGRAQARVSPSALHLLSGSPGKPSPVRMDHAQERPRRRPRRTGDPSDQWAAEPDQPRTSQFCCQRSSGSGKQCCLMAGPPPCRGGVPSAGTETARRSA
jgi:hypothetical protein